MCVYTHILVRSINRFNLTDWKIHIFRIIGVALQIGKCDVTQAHLGNKINTFSFYFDTHPITVGRDIHSPSTSNFHIAIEPVRDHWPTDRVNISFLCIENVISPTNSHKHFVGLIKLCKCT